MNIRLLIAPDSFKQCRDAETIATVLARGAKAAAEQLGVRLVVDRAPMSDGGEGFIAVVHRGIGGEFRTTPCTSVDTASWAPPVEARWLWHKESRTAFGETAEVVGLDRTQSSTPLERTALGVGEYLRAMRAGNPQRIVLGVGGTATVEGGASVTYGLGARFFRDGESIDVLRASDALKATRIVLPPSWNDVVVQCWCDVTTPLIGPEGAVVTFAPQKGASGEVLARLMAEVDAWARLAADRFGAQCDAPGTGAGGGIPFGVRLVTGASLEPGGPALIELLKMEQRVAQADLIWTGEGGVDSTTIRGKLVGTLLTLAHRWNKPVTVFTGQVRGNLGSFFDGVGIVNLTGNGESTARSMAQVETRLEAAARQVLEQWVAGLGE